MILLHSQANPAAVALRPYRPDDLRAVVDLDRICFSVPFRFSMRSMRRFAQAANAISLVACEIDSASIVGFVIVHLMAASAGLRGYVVTLDMHPAFGRCGVGSELLREAEYRSIQSGATRMDLHVHTDNLGAIAFYQARHYREKTRSVNFYGPGRDAFVYGKQLHTS